MTLDLKKIAEEREVLHKNHTSSRPLSKNYEYIGLKGEAQFSEEFGINLDLELRPGGDKGSDFSTKLGSIDVKTARKAYNLIVEKNKVDADIYVLAQYSDSNDKAILLGWAVKNQVLDAPAKDFGYNIINHYIPKSKLMPMDSLKNFINGANGG